MRTPLELLLEEIAIAEDWGRFKFVPHGSSRLRIDQYSWVPDLVPGPEEDAWHPEDLLLAPLYDEQGKMLGTLSIDVPLNGRRPDAAQRQLLERYAAQAERALVIGAEREALSRRVRLAETTRHVVRFAVSEPDIEQALDDCRFSLLEGFRADDLAIRTYATDRIAQGGSASRDAPDVVRALVHSLSRECWQHQRAAAVSSLAYDEDMVDLETYEIFWAYITSLGYQSAILVPIGAGTQCLGHLILFRKDDILPWRPDERQSCLDVARDIGQAVLSSRNLAREQRLVSELRQLTSYKTELLSTVSHELKNPLGAITGHLELVAAAPDLADDVRFSVAAIDRASKRLVRVVDDLLTLAAVEDPDTAYDYAPVDVRPLLDASLELVQLAAEQRQLVIDVVAPTGPLLVLGDERGLEQVVTNLISNAVKYSPKGGRVLIEVGISSDLVQLSVTDEGIGISTDDQANLFTEFFRSTNPMALAEPGTGLGLAICARIMSSHGGRIEVESELGRGSTFRVRIPQNAHRAAG